MRMTRVFGVALGIFGVATVFFAHNAQATNSSVMPNPSQFSPGREVRLVVSRLSLGNGLQAPMSRVKIYSTTPNPTLTIRGLGHCQGGTDNDTNTTSETVFTVYRTDAGGNEGSYLPRLSNNATCGGRTMSNPVTMQLSGSSRSELRGRKMYYIYNFQAEIKGGGVNSFTLQTSNGLIGYSNQSGDQFALQVRHNGTGTSNFNIPFGTDCEESRARPVTISWFDDDWGGIQTNGDFNFRLYNQTTNSYETLSSAGPGYPYTQPRYGGNVRGAVQFTARPGHKYIWQWTGVHDANGIQFRLPFDSINYNLDCGSFTSSCSLVINGNGAGIVTVAAGSEVDIGVGAYNGGELPEAVWPIWGQDGVAHAAKRYKVGLRTSPFGAGQRIELYGGRSTGFGPVLFGGENALGTKKFTAPTAAGDYSITSELIYENVRWSGITCPPKTLRVTTASITATCELIPNGIPASVNFGETFSAIVRVSNTGSTALNTTSATGIELRAAATGNNVLKTTSPLNIHSIGGTNIAAGTTRDVTITNLRTNADGDQKFRWQVYNKASPAGYLGVPCEQTITAKANRPFLRIEGSDVLASAVLVDNGQCREAREAYGYSENNKGYIKTNGNRSEDESGLSGYSSGQYGAFSIGNIGSLGRNNFSGNGGYLRQESLDEDAEGTGTYRDLTFANTNTSDYGYYYDDAAGTIPCLNTQELEAMASSFPTMSSSINQAAVNAAVAPDGSLRFRRIIGDAFLNNVTIPANGKLVIVVSGTLNITDNVSYASAQSAAGQITFPTLTIIAKGGINITANAKTISGYYITPGTIHTCSDVTSTPTVNVCSVGASDVNGNLVINGGLAAKRILWKRNFGTLDTNSKTYPRSSGGQCAVRSVYQTLVYNSTPYPPPGDGSVRYNEATIPEERKPALFDQANWSCAAELVRFNPGYYFANPFSTTTGAAVSSIPVSTTELPPIY